MRNHLIIKPCTVKKHSWIIGINDEEKGIKGVTIDNLTFQLHYKVTTAILMIGAALTTSKQFLGDPIACEVVNKKHGTI